MNSKEELQTENITFRFNCRETCSILLWYIINW